MKAIRIHRFGTSADLKYEDVPLPAVTDGQILVKVYAASVNHLDIKKASGAVVGSKPLEFPWIPGFDFAGVVENPGIPETKFSKGDKVYGNTPGGAYAEYLAVSPSTVVKKPFHFSYAEAASVPHVAETAWQAIHTHGGLKEGEKILVHGAAGAVGAFAVQFARIAGAEIYATAAGTDRQYLESLGAGTVIDYRQEDFSIVLQDIDLVIMLVGGDTEEKSYEVLKKGGRLVSTVGLAHEDIAKQKGITAVAMGINQSGHDLEMITGMINSGAVKTDVEITYPLEDAALAWKLLSGEDPARARFTHGKIVLEMTKGQ